MATETNFVGDFILSHPVRMDPRMRCEASLEKFADNLK
jgi:hypothetical protein